MDVYALGASPPPPQVLRDAEARQIYEAHGLDEVSARAAMGLPVDESDATLDKILYGRGQRPPRPQRALGGGDRVRQAVDEARDARMRQALYKQFMWMRCTEHRKVRVTL